MEGIAAAGRFMPDAMPPGAFGPAAAGIFATTGAAGTGMASDATSAPSGDTLTTADATIAVGVGVLFPVRRFFGGGGAASAAAVAATFAARFAAAFSLAAAFRRASHASLLAPICDSYNAN